MSIISKSYKIFLRQLAIDFPRRLMSISIDSRLDRPVINTFTHTFYIAYVPHKPAGVIAWFSWACNSPETGLCNSSYKCR